MSANVKPKTDPLAWIKRYWPLLILAVIIVWVLLPSTNKFAWEEEVQLQDGRVITIKRTQWFDPTSGASFADVHNGPGVPLKSRIELELEEKKLLWEEAAYPMILQIDQKQPIVVSRIFNCEVFREYGRPYPGYLIQRYENGTWRQTDIAEINIPGESNLLLNVLEFGKRKHMSLEAKKKIDYSGYSESDLKLDRKFRSAC